MSEDAEILGEKKEPQKKSVLREVLESLIIAVILAMVIRTFILQPFWIPSGSMEPTLMISDHIIVNKIGYKFWPPQRGDIIVFKYPLDPSRDFVKRLVGLPGEKVQIRDSKLYVNGKLVPQDYLPPGLKFADYGPVVVPSDSYWMLGDNRNNSDDSRSWGYMPKDLLIGKAEFIYWPLNRIRMLTGK